MIDYIKRLKVCIRWFQDLELSYSLEQEKLKNSLELNQQKCMELGKDYFSFFSTIVLENPHQFFLLMWSDLFNFRVSTQNQGRRTKFNHCGAEKELLFFPREVNEGRIGKNGK